MDTPEDIIDPLAVSDKRKEGRKAASQGDAENAADEMMMPPATPRLPYPIERRGRTERHG